MRKSAVALALLLLASVGVAAPAVSAAEPKVVIIVGATHSVTGRYREFADQAYAEATKYTSNVVKVYSPDATWSRVKSAVAGASVVIYFGHGNGWPSPYTYDPNYTTKNGFGLNATAGAGDNNNVYYGEPYVSTLALAPGAIVMLHHLCYAAGNSEPGHPQPSVSVARQRVDNYAAGFLKAGAAAVIADGHAGPVGYLAALFSGQQPVEQLWATQSNANGNVVSFPSTRTPGATAYQDPETPTSGFYRSLVVKSGGAVVGGTTGGETGGAADTSVDPPTLAVPGNASVAHEGATLFGDPSSGIASRALSVGTRLRVGSGLSAFATSSQNVVQVQGLDDPSILGYMVTSDLLPRDSAGPRLRSLDLGGGAISPNGDGVADAVNMSGAFSEAVNWTATVSSPDGHPLVAQSGFGASFQMAWDPLASGQSVGDGQYRVTVSAVDAWQNAPLSTSAVISVDSTPSQLLALAPAPTTVTTFSPNGDGYRDTAIVTATTSEPGSLVASVRNESGSTLRTWTVTAGSAATSIAWDGRDAVGGVVADGRYVLTVAPRDAAGNTGSSQERMVTVLTGLRGVTTTRAIFYPQDLDGLAPTTDLSFTLLKPMSVTWTIRDAAAKVVDTHLASTLLQPGTHTWTFDGRGSDGTMLKPGKYLSYVTAVDGSLAIAQSVAVELDAFVVKPSDTTPGRGQTVTVTVTTAEPLAAAPRVTVSQPGLSAWSVGTVKLSSTTYRATIKLKTGGGTGSVAFKATGKDTSGATQYTRRTYPLH